MCTLVLRYMGLASCRIAELHRRRRQLRHAVAAGVDEAHERLPVYSSPLSWASYCNPGLVPQYNITQPISLLVNLRSSSRPAFHFNLATVCFAASAVPSNCVCRPRVLPCPGARHTLFWRLVRSLLYFLSRFRCLNSGLFPYLANQTIQTFPRARCPNVIVIINTKSHHSRVMRPAKFSPLLSIGIMYS
jgi:hypothetical protein